MEYDIKVIIPDIGEQFWSTEITSYNFSTSVFNPFDDLTVSIYPHKDLKTVIDQTNGPYRIQFFLNGYLQFDGRISTQKIDSDGLITLDCGNYINEMQNQNCDGIVKLKIGESVLSGLQRNLKHLGYGTIQTDWAPVKKQRTGINFPKNSAVANLAKGSERCGKTFSGDWKPSKNESTYDFVRRLTQHYNVFLHIAENFPDFSLIVPNTINVSPTYSVYRNKENSDSNVTSLNIIRNFDKIPTYSRHTGKVITNQAAIQLCSTDPKGNPIEVKPEYKSKNVTDKLPITDFEQLLHKEFVPVTSTPPTGKIYRPMIGDDQYSKNLGETESWEKLKIRRLYKDLLVVNFTIPKHDIDDKILTPDTIVNIQDDITGLNKDLYISEVSFSYGDGDGPSSSVKCYDPAFLDFSK